MVNNDVKHTNLKHLKPGIKTKERKQAERRKKRKKKEKKKKKDNKKKE